MAKKLTIIVGIIIVFVGFLGFTKNPLIGRDALLATNWIVQAILIVVGFLFIIAAVMLFGSGGKRPTDGPLTVDKTTI